MSREKQIEEMIKAIEKCSCVYTPCEQECAQCSNEELYDDTLNHIARTLYEAGYRKQEWISVEERLPKEGVRVLVWLKGDNIQYTSIDTDRLSLKKWVRWGRLVTHWMPLPSLPEKEKNDD